MRPAKFVHPQHPRRLCSDAPNFFGGRARKFEKGRWNRAWGAAHRNCREHDFDGKGHVFKDTRIVIEGSKIVAINPKAGPMNYDLRGLTVLPGWIDSHVHITWIFGKDGKNAGAGRQPGSCLWIGR